jgi:ribonuclease P protein component
LRKIKAGIIKKQFTLGKQERLKSRKRIELLFKSGKSFAVFPFRVYYQYGLADGSTLRAGFGASAKNFRKAVDRNRIKRVTKEVYRLQKPELEALLVQKSVCLDLFFIYTAKELPAYAIVHEKIGVTLNRLIKIINENNIAHL